MDRLMMGFFGVRIPPHPTPRFNLLQPGHCTVWLRPISYSMPTFSLRLVLLHVPLDSPLIARFRAPPEVFPLLFSRSIFVSALLFSEKSFPPLGVFHFSYALRQVIFRDSEDFFPSFMAQYFFFECGILSAP